MPASGSAYTYTYASLGEFIAFIVGMGLLATVYQPTAMLIAAALLASA